MESLLRHSPPSHPLRPEVVQCHGDLIKCRGSREGGEVLQRTEKNGQEKEGLAFKHWVGGQGGLNVTFLDGVEQESSEKCGSPGLGSKHGETLPCIRRNVI